MSFAPLDSSLPLVCFPIDELQRSLSRKHLHPALEALDKELTQLRRVIDQSLRPSRANYPLGACEVIARQAARRVRSDTSPPGPGLQSVQRFLAAGGQMRRIWGELRGKYFQTALQIGDLYVDVANDSVDTGKAPVEILPLAESGFRNIVDYSQFAKIAHAYWNVQCFPNLYFPGLAPYLPLLGVHASGRLVAYSSVPYIFVSNLTAGFQPARKLLQDAESWPAPPPEIRQRLQQRSVFDFRPKDGLSQETLSAQIQVGQRLKTRLEICLNMESG